MSGTIDRRVVLAMMAAGVPSALGAGKKCPYFQGKVGKRVHLGFADPAKATGSEGEVLTIFRNARDDIRAEFHKLYEEDLRPRLG